MTAALEAPNQDAIRSTDARPGTWNSGRTTGLSRTPRNSIIPQSVRNGRMKLKEITIQNSVPHRSIIDVPVSAEIIISGPTPNTTMQAMTAPTILEAR